MNNIFHEQLFNFVFKNSLTLGLLQVVIVAHDGFILIRFSPDLLALQSFVFPGDSGKVYRLLCSKGQIA